MAQEERVAFSGEKEWEPDPNRKVKGLKIANKVAPEKKEAEHSKEVFEAAAKNFMQNKQQMTTHAVNLAKQYKKALQDRTLDQNKTPMVRDVEKEIVANLVMLASALNQEDAQQPEGYGSVILAQLALKMLFVQRDAINELSYQVELLKREAAKNKEKV